MRKILCLTILLSWALLSNAKQDSSHVVSTAAPVTYKTKGKLVAGIAGIYNKKKEGAKTAGGEAFSEENLTAASNRFPLNSLVKVINTRNKKTVIVLVNERMSALAVKKGFAIELSTQAAKSLAFNKKLEFKVNMQQVVVTNLLSILNDIDTVPIITDSIVRKDTSASITYQKTGNIIKGIASFYSANLDGTKTATGEIFRHKKLTGASNNLPLNTWVLVTNLKNKKTVIVRINDHMHPRMKKKGRVIDLSKAAADILDYVEDGLTRVSLETIQLNGTLRPGDSVKVKDSIPGQQPALVTVADSLQQDSVVAAEKPAEEKAVTGTAVLFSDDLDGSKTAAGTIFRHTKLFAGSNSFKLNTLVKITNLTNSKSLVLRINDHLHARAKKKGRILELSRAAAKKLDFPKSGLAKVEIEAVHEVSLE
jgi:rare lipoprotein A (peptidoglycan hydrolase)